LIPQALVEENEIYLESWQNGYCTSLENWRAQALGGSNPSLSAESIIKLLLEVLFTLLNT
jgi:hypothetical protein